MSSEKQPETAVSAGNNPIESQKTKHNDSQKSDTQPNSSSQVIPKFFFVQEHFIYSKRRTPHSRNFHTREKRK